MPGMNACEEAGDLHPKVVPPLLEKPTFVAFVTPFLLKLLYLLFILHFIRIFKSTNWFLTEKIFLFNIKIS
jgi:hypothetical protein